MNLSSRVQNETGTNLLKKGLNFNIERKPYKPQDIIPKIEPSLAKLSTDDAYEARFQIANILQRQKPRPPNLTNEQLQALQTLKRDEFTHICPADKGNITVIMNKNDYQNKVQEHLTDEPYITIENNKSTTVLTKMKAEISSYIRGIKEKLGKSVWLNLNP